MTYDTEQQSRIPVLVTDFDGTMTRQDFYQLVSARLLPPQTPDYWGKYLAGRMTHFQALQRIFTCIVADESVVLETARMMELDPKAGEAVRQLQASGWEIIVASAGCRWYIDHLLGEQDIHITVHANPGAFNPEFGLLMELPEGSPYLSESTGIDKEAVVREMVAKHRIVAFAGDGRPDEPAAMLVPPEHRFARGWLAETLRAKEIPFRPFEYWSEIGDMLLGGT